MFRVLEACDLGRLKLRNRFWRSGTYDAMADETGAVTERSIKLFGDLAAGGVGLIVTGYAYVSPRGRARARQLGIHRDEMIPGLRRLVNVVHGHGAKIALQVCHAGLASGYLASQGEPTLAPSPLGDPRPHRAMAAAEVEGTVEDFAAAAVRARAAGFDAVQLHGAHGFLLSQFLSPITNRRQDEWGGSRENRRRLHLEVVTRTRTAVGPDFPILMKLGIADEGEGGVSLEEGLAALQAMAEAGLDAVEVSGGIISPPFASREGFVRALPGGHELPYYRERAARAGRQVGIPVALVGGVRSLETAEAVVGSGDADFVSLCRPLVREPGLIERWSRGDRSRAECISCNRCLSIVQREEPLECGERRRPREAGA